MKAALGVIAAALVLTSGCVQQDWIDRTLVTENVTGGWAGSFGEGNCRREVRLDLQQDGSKVTGRAIFLGASDTYSVSGVPFPILGNVAGDLFTFKSPRGTASGEVTVSGDDMRGQILWGCGNSQMSLHRLDSPSRTGSPPR